jgi:RNA polymerase sigma-70 factor (ECF subfamily)
VQATLDSNLMAGALLGFGPAHETAAPAAPHEPAAPRATDLEPHRPGLTKYARRWLHSQADVEDVVQETFAAALACPQGFAGRSTAGTWLRGILEHKIVDTYRRQARESLLEKMPDDDELDALFTPDGQWRTAPGPWGDPQAVLDRRDFDRMLDDCLARLPRHCARAFRLRELMDMQVAAICDVLAISSDDCYAMLHRARMRLRALVEQQLVQNSANL